MKKIWLIWFFVSTFAAAAPGCRSRHTFRRPKAHFGTSVIVDYRQRPGEGKDDLRFRFLKPGNYDVEFRSHRIRHRRGEALPGHFAAAVTKTPRRVTLTGSNFPAHLEVRILRRGEGWEFHQLGTW